MTAKIRYTCYSVLTDDDIKMHPVFRPFDENWLFTTNTVTYAMVAPVRTRILADGIPAASFAAGTNARIDANKANSCVFADICYQNGSWLC